MRKNKLIQLKVDYLNRRLGSSFYIEDNSSVESEWLILMDKLPNSSLHKVSSKKLSSREMIIYLDGMIDCLDGYATAGV